MNTDPNQLGDQEESKRPDDLHNERTRAPGNPVAGDKATTIGHVEPPPVLPPGVRVRHFGDYELLGEIARGGIENARVLRRRS